MKTILSCLLAAALPLTAAAQTPAAPADTATTYRHQLGLTASPVLDGFFKNNRSLPLSLLYKRQVKPNQAWRVGVVGSYRCTDRYKAVPLSNRDYTERSLGLEAYVGYEFQKTLTRRWIGYAGLDVGISYDQYRLQEYSERGELVNGVNTVLSSDYQQCQNTYAGFARPLVGIRYHLRPFLYLSTEAALPVHYSHYQIRSTTTRTVRDTGASFDTAEGRFQEKRVNIALRPISQLTLHYCFGRL